MFGNESGDFVLGAREVDYEPFDLAQPSFAFSFGDTGEKVVAHIAPSS
ncbi:hypothetical protein [Streptomyces lutosisoli]|uniref:Uncharacterized protein n=1 Tax=Streptomyces lutosisoli TaxID=2665721 RepID=A0ABW2VV45_9ACTN